MQKRIEIDLVSLPSECRKDTGISSVECMRDANENPYVIIETINVFLGFPDAKDRQVSGHAVKRVQVALPRVSAKILVERLEEKLCREEVEEHINPSDYERVLEDKALQLSHRELIENLVTALHGLSCAASGIDAGQSMTKSEIMNGARGIMKSLGFPIQRDLEE